MRLRIPNALKSSDLNSTGLRVLMTGASIPQTMCPRAVKELEFS